MSLKFKDMVALYVKGNTGQWTGKAGVTIFKGPGQNPQGGRLVDSQDNEKILCTILLSQSFYFILYRQTYGTGCSSDKTGCVLIDDLSTGCLETVGDCCPGNVIPFSKDDDFFSF